MKQGFIMSKVLIKDRVMSSIEISEVVDKKHKHVCRDIKVQLGVTFFNRKLNNFVELYNE
jgi:phage regulator Rha-like protein